MNPYRVDRTVSTLTCNLATMVLVRTIYLLIFRLVGRAHIPVKPIFQTRCIVLIFYPLKLFLAPGQCRTRLNQMRL